jgi:transposase InsO family protein
VQIVSQELGVSVATLERWRADALSVPTRERVWTAAARLQAVIVTAAMDESQRSAWCRENGVYPSELEQWKQSAMAALNETPRSGPVRRKRETHANASRNSNEICDAGQSARRDDSIIGAVKTTAGDLPARRRGRMILVEDRQMIAARIAEAQRKGARLKVACELAGIDVRTLQRWKREGLEHGDRRPHAVRPVPTHALSAEERAHIVQIANEPRFAELPPARIVPMLADEGTYIASESSFNRVLRAHGQMRHRGRAKTPQRRRPPSTHIATAPRQLWCWDVTFLAGQVAGQWFYLYLILDVYSRKIVGFEVHETDSSDHAVDLLRRTALAEGVHGLLNKPVLHSDNGATVKATTVLAMINWLGLKASHSRPRVSDDNSFVEALFRTAKYRPQYPANGFGSLKDARCWATRFVHWYNHEHRHSGIRHVSPAERHAGHDAEILLPSRSIPSGESVVNAALASAD